MKKGFTLIEMLIVIAIIGILSTILAPKMREQLGKAKDAKVLGTLGVFRTALQISVIDGIVMEDIARNGNLKIDNEDIESKMNKSSLDILNDGKLIVGGFRADKDEDIEYGKEMSFLFKTEKNIDDKYKYVRYRKNGKYRVNEDTEVIIGIKGSPKNGYSSEGKKWNSY